MSEIKTKPITIDELLKKVKGEIINLMPDLCYYVQQYKAAAAGIDDYGEEPQYD